MEREKKQSERPLTNPVLNFEVMIAIFGFSFLNDEYINISGYYGYMGWKFYSLQSIRVCATVSLRSSRTTS